MTRATAFLASALIVAFLTACGSIGEEQRVVKAEQSISTSQAVASTETGVITFGIYEKPSDERLSEIQDGGVFVATFFLLYAGQANPDAYPGYEQVFRTRPAAELETAAANGRYIGIVDGTVVESVIVSSPPADRWEPDVGRWVTVRLRMDRDIGPSFDPTFLVWIKPTEESWVVQEIKFK